MESTHHRYRTKPVDIEAFQLTRERMDDNRDWPYWLKHAWGLPNDEPGFLTLDTRFHMGQIERRDAFLIGTLEGALKVSPDDWIIRGVSGKLYPCKPDIFEQTYEPA